VAVDERVVVRVNAPRKTDLTRAYFSAI